MKDKRVTSPDEKFKEYFVFQFQRSIINIYKRHLTIIEDLAQEHKIMLKKLENTVDSETLKNIDYFNIEKYNYIRKKTLDVGNESIRDFEKNIDLLNVTLKSTKKI